ncbi:MAG: AsmA-like C-terminal region-containing protein [Bacteroidales bacterium]
MLLFRGMMSSHLRKLLRIVSLFTAAILGLILIVSVLVSLFYEKTTIRFMKKYLDEHLLTELSMGEIQFRVLKGFPNATVEISDVVLLSGHNFSSRDFQGSFSDTLLQAKSVLLQFDLLKLFEKKFELKKIDVSNGRANILFDKKNNHNLNIWKSADSSGQKNAVNLRSIGLNELAVRFVSLSSQVDISSNAGKVGFRGSISAEEVLSGEIRGSLSRFGLTVKDNGLLKNASVQLSGKLVYSSGHFRFSDTRIQVNKAVAMANGQVQGGKNKNLDLTISMPKFGLEELVSLIPLPDSPLMHEMAFSGQGKMYLTIKGSLSVKGSLLYNSGFELNNCSARNPRTRTAAQDISVKGTLSGNNASTFLLQINQFSAELGKGNINGSFRLSDLNQLRFSADVSSRIDLKALKEFAGMDSVEMMEGMIRSDIVASGDLKQFTADSAVLGLNYIKSGVFIAEDAAFRFKNVPVTLDHISGKAIWGKSVRLDSLQLRLNETDLLIHGEMANLPDYLMHHHILKSRLEISTDNLDISKYLNQPAGNKSKSGYKSLSVFPPGIYLKARVKANKFKAGKFEANQVILNLSALGDSMFIENFSMNFPDGSITGNAFLQGKADKTYYVTCNAQPRKINIQQLFAAFNNFTQHFIVEKNIKGQLTGTIGFSGIWDSTLHVIPKSIQAKGDLVITNGELVQFEPMMKLSKYIDIDELRHIRFRTLKNTIYISNRMVTIPEMAINSTAFNIKAAGTHSFDNVFDYRLKVLLSEVLFNKARKKKKEIDEFLMEDSREDQTTIPLMIVGTPDNYDVRLDKKKAFSITRDNIRGKDTGSAGKSSSDNFRIEWEEPEPKKEIKKPVPEAEKDNDIVIEWEDE